MPTVAWPLNCVAFRERHLCACGTCRTDVFSVRTRGSESCLRAILLATKLIRARASYKSDVDVVAQNDFCARHGAFSLSVLYWKKTLARNQVGPTERYAIARRKIKPARAATEHRLADVTVIRNTSADRARARAIERAERTERSSSAL